MPKVLKRDLASEELPKVEKQRKPSYRRALPLPTVELATSARADYNGDPQNRNGANPSIGVAHRLSRE